nr:nuclear transcription factor Y subunit B-4-like [Ipomoea trifida]
MREAIPRSARIAEEAKETVQKWVTEFIHYVTAKANERAKQERRKTVTTEDLIWAMRALGLGSYVLEFDTWQQEQLYLLGTKAVKSRSWLAFSLGAFSSPSMAAWPPISSRSTPMDNSTGNPAGTGNPILGNARNQAGSGNPITGSATSEPAATEVHAAKGHSVVKCPENNAERYPGNGADCRRSEAKETVQKCVTEFIHRVTAKANERAKQERRKTVTTEDLIWAMRALGLGSYAQELTAFIMDYCAKHVHGRAATHPLPPRAAARPAGTVYAGFSSAGGSASSSSPFGGDYFLDPSYPPTNFDG